MIRRTVAASLLAARFFVLGACGSDESSGEAPATGGTAAGATPAGNAGSGGNASAGIAAASGVAGAEGLAGAGGGSNPNAVPADESAASLASFLAAKTYQSAPSWVAETPAPREGGMGSGSPHGRVRVYFNEAVLGSIAAGNGLLETMIPHTAGSMAVKEMYDSTDTLVGVAAALKLEGNFQRWAYYCHGPNERCALGRGSFTVDEPLYGIAGQVDCGICHGGFVFTAPPK